MSFPGPTHGSGQSGLHGQQGPPSVPPMPPGPPPGPWTQPAPQGLPGDTGTPGMAPGGGPAGPPRKMTTGRKVLCTALCVFGVLGLLAGGALVAHTFSNANQNVSNRTGYGPVMWRNEPAERLFPKTLTTMVDAQTSATDRRHAEWNRVGISQKTGCREGLSGRLAAEAKKLGCKAVLRATYVDPTGNVVATIAYVVLRDLESPGEEMDKVFESGKPGVKAFAVPRTIAADWADRNRNGSSGTRSNDQYAPFTVAATVGAVDGHKSGHLPEQWDFSDSSDRKMWNEAAEALARTGYRYLDSRLQEVAKK